MSHDFSPSGSGRSKALEVDWNSQQLLGAHRGHPCELLSSHTSESPGKQPSGGAVGSGVQEKFLKLVIQASNLECLGRAGKRGGPLLLDPLTFWKSAGTSQESSRFPWDSCSHFLEVPREHARSKLYAAEMRPLMSAKHQLFLSLANEGTSNNRLG